MASSPPLLLLLLLLVRLLTPPSATYASATTVGGKLDDKQHQAQEPQQLNVTPRRQAESATTGAPALEEAAIVEDEEEAMDRPASGPAAGTTAGEDKRQPSRLGRLQKSAGQQRRKQAGRRMQRQQSRSPQEQAVKAQIIGDFVREHGDTIRRSRRHADLFDGSGYLIDLMEELNEYESRAEAHQQKERQRRSTGDAESPKPSPQEPAAFASLEEALTHLNGGQQFEVASDGLNLRFQSTEEEDEEDEEDEDEVPEEAGQDRRRKRRSAVDDSSDDEASGYDEAAASLERLDETLAELARYLDELAADEAASSEAGDAAAAGSGRRRPMLEPYRRSMADAYNSLAQLRGVAQGMLAKHGQQGQGQPPRLRDLFPDAEAAWHMDTAALTQNVRQLERLYRRSDEL